MATKEVILPPIDNNKTLNSNLNKTNQSKQSFKGKEELQSNLMKTNKTNKTIYSNASNTIYNSENQDSSTLKNKYYILEDYVVDLQRQFEETKTDVNKLHDEELAADLILKDHYKKNSKHCYNELQKVEDYVNSEFMNQNSENLKLQNQIDQEKKDNSKLTKKYLELIERLSNLYTYVGAEDPNLEKQ